MSICTHTAFSRIATATALWLTVGSASAAPFCAVLAFGPQCFYYDIQSCRRAVGTTGTCVANPESFRSDPAPIGSGGIRFIDRNPAIETFREGVQGRRREALDDQEMILRALEIEQGKRERDRARQTTPSQQEPTSRQSGSAIPSLETQPGGDKESTLEKALQVERERANRLESELQRQRAKSQSRFSVRPTAIYRDANIDLLIDAAKKDDPQAQMELGNRYRDGRGVKQNLKESVIWYRRAAAKNLPEAMYQLGWAYYQGIGVQKDQAEAIHWGRKAADAGHPIAQRQLGSLYISGKLDFPKDYHEAARWFSRAAEQGDGDSQAALADLYMRGLGVPHAPPEAYRWARESADQGNALGEYVLGLLYLQGIGVSKDQSRAFEFIERSAAKGFPQAMQMLSGIKGN